MVAAARLPLTGLTVIGGANESGKTTLAECVMRLLFGFPRQQFNSELERYRPWNTGAPYRARLAYELDDGRGFETTRDFASDVKTVTRAIDTKEQVDAWSGGRKASPGQSILNVSLETYRAAAFIGPGELQSKEDADFGALGERLAAVVGSAGDEGADAASLALATFATKDIGSEASRTTRFAAARAAREQAEQDLEKASARFHSLKPTIEDRIVAMADVDMLEASCRKAEFAVKATRLRGLRERAAVESASLVARAEIARDTAGQRSTAGGAGQSSEEQNRYSRDRTRSRPARSPTCGRFCVRQSRRPRTRTRRTPRAVRRMQAGDRRR